MRSFPLLLLLFLVPFVGATSEFSWYTGDSGLYNDSGTAQNDFNSLNGSVVINTTDVKVGTGSYQSPDTNNFIYDTNSTPWPNGSFSITFWDKFTQAPGITSEVIFQGFYSLTPGRALWVVESGQHGWGMHINNEQQNGPIAPANLWEWQTLEYDAENKTAYWFTNNTLVSTYTFTTIIDFTNPQFGLFNNNDLESGFYGKIDDLRVIPKLLNNSERAFIYNNGIGTNQSLSALEAGCTPNYICNGYAACGITDNRSCNSVTDLNFCGITYTGNYSEFTPQSCNYCTSTISGPNLGTCISGNQTRTYYYTNTCCATTNLTSDCTIGANTTQLCGFAPDYTTGDLGKSAVSTLAAFLISLGSFAVITTIILGIRFIQTKKP
jgi:hypothetical protein